MSSKTKKDVEIEKSLYEGAFLRRQAELKNQELEGGKIAKDPRLRHLSAKVRQANRRLLAISKIEKKIEELALRKSERATEKPKEPKSSKKSAPKPSKKKPKDKNLKMKNGVKPSKEKPKDENIKVKNGVKPSKEKPKDENIEVKNGVKP